MKYKVSKYKTKGKYVQIPASNTVVKSFWSGGTVNVKVTDFSI